MDKTELISLINTLNEISYQHSKLMTVVLDFDEIYKKQEPTNTEFISLLFHNGAFIQQAVLSARESLILGTQSLCLGEHVPFHELIEGCTNLELQTYHIEKLNLHGAQEKIVLIYFNALRREIFSRIYSQNKDFKKLSELTKETLNYRKDLFMKAFA